MTGGGPLGVIDAFGMTGANTQLRLLNTGKITAGLIGEPSGILIKGGGNEITNHGTITALADSAIEVFNAGTASATCSSTRERSLVVPA